MRDVEFVIACTTLPQDADMETFARTLVEERLVACVSTQIQVRSVYRWQGAIEDGREQLLIMKTTTTRVDRLSERVQQLHPYEVPEFVVLPVIAGNAAYLDWIKASTTV